MTKSTVAFTTNSDSVEAGAALGRDMAASLSGYPVHAAIVFASARHDYTALLRALKAECGPEIMVGCSSAGEFVNEHRGEHAACAIGLHSTEIRFAAGLGRDLRSGPEAAARKVISTFHGVGGEPTLFHTALVLTDALAGQAEDFIEYLNVATGGSYRFFGGGAGDDAKFDRTHVFYGTEAIPNAAVALEMLSQKPIGIGVQHGWQPASPPLRVTESAGMKLISLNAAPAIEAVEDYAEATGQRFDRSAPLDFFLHNTIGIQSGSGYKLRVPLAVNPDGSIMCAADIPEGVSVHLMRATSSSAADAAEVATKSALEQLNGNTPEVAIFFDCVATRLRLGEKFGLELNALGDTLGGTKYAGCNTYGQIARSTGQFSGFHNCTAVVCVIPE